MDLSYVENLKQELKEKRLWPDKTLGQNFLVDRSVLDKIVAAADICEQDVILEVGPGLGVLTAELAKKAKLVLAVEKDRKLVNYLREKFKHSDNVKIICEDILQFHGLTSEQLFDYKLVSNLPYNITSPVVNRFVTAEYPPKEIVLMLQKEMAERLTAKPGNRERGFMTVLVEYYAKSAEIVEIVNRKSFYPEPDVDSAVIKLIMKQGNTETRKQGNDEASEQIDDGGFLRFVKMGFSQKRRQIHHPLTSGLHLGKNQVMLILEQAGIKPDSRAEQISLAEWLKLYEIINNIVNKT